MSIQTATTPVIASAGGTGQSLAEPPSGNSGPGLSAIGAPAISATVTGLIVSLQVGGQLCGLPVHAVRDVLGPQTITRVPLAAPEIAGNLNLRGRIVTTIDLRTRLGLDAPDTTPAMSVVTEHGPELYALLVDRVLEVVSVAERPLAPLPPTLAAGWSRYGLGVYQLPEGLLIMLDVDRLLALSPRTA